MLRNQHFVLNNKRLMKGSQPQSHTYVITKFPFKVLPYEIEELTFLLLTSELSEQTLFKSVLRCCLVTWSTKGYNSF